MHFLSWPTTFPRTIVATFPAFASHHAQPPFSRTHTSFFLSLSQSSPWWEDRTLTSYDSIDFKGVHWAGWYDIFLQPMIETWEGYNGRSQARNQQRLVIGPRGHCLTPFPLLFPDDRLADIW